jgi:hypothetical protein
MTTLNNFRGAAFGGGEDGGFMALTIRSSFNERQPIRVSFARGRLNCSTQGGVAIQFYSMLFAVRAWILLSTLLVGAGWILSALHELNRTGYAIVFALAAMALFFCQGNIQWPTIGLTRMLPKIRHRFKRPAPLLFLILASMSFVSGVLYPPYNSDTYAYRLPRVLHWLGQEQWDWIHTWDARMNVAACGYEWFVAPMILFTHTDRYLFLINWIPYLLLPGLAFCVLKSLGVRLRVAWWWGWLLASGWCYVMQSASVSNDSFAVVYALAAVALAMKAGETGMTGDFWLSLLSVALLTGVKQTGIPLAALWMIAAWPSRRMAFANPRKFFLVAASGALVSVVPTIYFNWLHTGTWDGVLLMEAEYPLWHVQLDSPFWGIVGNAFYIPVLSLLPPFFPWSGAWNHAMDIFVATPFGAHFKSFERFGAVDPGISEYSAGIGLAIILVAAISIWAARKYQVGHPIKSSCLQTALKLCPWILLVIFMAKVGVTQNTRFLAGYYIFFFPSLLAGTGHEKLVRQGWWQKMALLCMAFSAVLLVVNTTRPLFPAVTVTQQLAAEHPHSKSITQLQDAYTVSRMFKSSEQQIAEKIPKCEMLVGYAAVGNAHLEPALWLPFGVRRIERVLKTDTPGQLAKQGIHYVVIEDRPSLDCNVTNWMTRYHAVLIAELTVQDNPQSHAYIMQLAGK